MWGKEKATEMLNDVGFTNVEVKKLAHDFQNYYYIAYKNKVMSIRYRILIETVAVQLLLLTI